VRAVRGTLWITQQGDARDHVVGVGACFDIERGGVTLVTAPDGPSAFKVTRSAPRLRGALARWFAVSRHYLMQPGRSS
jgi:hypothetical protein